MSYSELINSISSEHGVDPKLTEAVISVESSFNPSAVRYEPSGITSYGLMQVTMIAVKDLIGKTIPTAQLLNPATNIRFGVQYLKRQLDRYGNVADALAHYNSGMARKNSAGQYINSGGSTNVNSYVNKVLNAYAGLSIPFSFSNITDKISEIIDTQTLISSPYIFYAGMGLLLFVLILFRRK